MEKYYICPFCGVKLKKGSCHHNCSQKIDFFENFDIEELKKMYVDNEYSILDLGIYYNKKYKDILYSKIPDCTFRNIVKKQLGNYYRNIKKSVITSKKKAKYENTMLKNFGCKHNFEKNCSSRKKWEQKMLEEEGITNVFQRESVKEKIISSLISRYGSIENVNHMRGYFSTRDGFKEKYGENWEDEWNRFIESKKTATPEFYQKKYGRDWKEEWEKHCEKVRKSFSGKNHHNGLNEKCYEILDKFNIEYEKEFPIYYYNVNKQNYGKGYYKFYDIKINNLLIELNGIYWHCSPKKYKGTDIIKFPNNTYKRVQDIWDKDLLKKKLALDNGYYIETIWEDEFCEAILIEILKKYNLWKN